MSHGGQVRVNWQYVYKVKDQELPNNTLHPPPGVGLGANFMHAFARRG